jgi:hypothetical protein
MMLVRRRRFEALVRERQAVFEAFGEFYRFVQENLEEDAHPPEAYLVEPTPLKRHLVRVAARLAYNGNGREAKA